MTPASGHPHQAGVRAIDIVQSPKRPASGRLLRTIEILAELGGVHGIMDWCKSPYRHGE